MLYLIYQYTFHEVDWVKYYSVVPYHPVAMMLVKDSIQDLF